MAATDWNQILTLYDQLLALHPSPIVKLNRAVALAEVQGAAAALALIDRLDLPDHHRVHAVRADLLRRVGDKAGAAEAYTRAMAGATNRIEREHLERRRSRLNLSDEPS